MTDILHKTAQKDVNANPFCAGVLSFKDIQREIKNQNLKIYPLAFKDEKLTGNIQIKSASIDITPSCLIMSVRTGRFLRIYEQKTPFDDKDNGNRYVYIEPRDTALVISREFFIIPPNICGNVHSRVTTVSAGLGHISTTIDPGWKGALLIAVSNPSSQRKKLDIQKHRSHDCPLATVTFSYLATACDVGIEQTKMPARVDILKRYMQIKPEWGKLQHFQKAYGTITHHGDFILTSGIIEALESSTNPEMWEEKLNEIEKVVLKEKVNVKRWKTNLRRTAKIGLKLLLSALFFAVVFTGLYVITPPGNTRPLNEVIADILRFRIPKDTNLALISAVIACVNFIKSIIRENQKRD